VALSRVKQKRQEIGVAQLNPHRAQRLEDVKLVQQDFKPL
jgi:hypothetical protein